MPLYVPSSGGGISSGTSFPSGPTENDLFHRTDRDLTYFYDGTRWLTTQLFSLDFANNTAFSATGIGVRLPHPGAAAGFEIYATEVYFSYFLSTTGNWTIAVASTDDGNAAVNITSETVSTTSAFVSIVKTVNAIQSTAIDNFALSVTENSGTAILTVSARMEYRRVG